MTKRRVAGSSQGVDPITAEILRNAFSAIATEMNANLARSAFSPVIYEMKDCSVAIFNEKAELLARCASMSHHAPSSPQRSRRPACTTFPTWA
jgi:N-methylhydantoinase B